MITILEININLEIWVDIPGFNNWYQVSSMGRVRSKDKRVPGRYGPTHRLSKGKLLNIRKNNKEYCIVDLYDDNKKHTLLVHRLVATAFIKNPNPSKYTIVNHKSGNKNDNSASNLEWTDNSGNMLHSYRMLNHQINSNNVSVILSDPNSGDILCSFRTIRDAARFINRDPSIVRQLIKSDKNIKYGYKWEKSSTTIENNDIYYIINTH